MIMNGKPTTIHHPKQAATQAGKVHSDMSKVCLTHPGNRPLKKQAVEPMHRNPPTAIAMPYLAVVPMVCFGILQFISFAERHF
jgi:hypothetical protein